MKIEDIGRMSQKLILFMNMNELTISDMNTLIEYINQKYEE